MNRPAVSSVDSARSAPLALVGKVATSAEFVRIGMNDEAFFEFEHWLERAVSWAHMESRQANLPMEGDAYAFVALTPDVSGPALTGVIVPSADAVGRAFPLAVVATMPRVLIARQLHLVPLAFGDFFDDACRLLREAPRATPAQLRDGLRALGAPAIGELDSAGLEWTIWSRVSTARAVWRTLFGAAAADHAVRAILVTISRAARGTPLPPLRLPLGHSAPAAMTLWLAIVARLAPEWAAAAFWSAERDHAIVAFEPEPASLLSDLWGPSIDGRPWWVRPAGPDDDGPALSSRASALLATQETSFETLLSALGEQDGS